MPVASLDDLQAFARRLNPGSHDEYSEGALARTAEEYAARRPPAVARFTWAIAGKTYPSFFEALADDDAKFDAGTLTLVDPPAADRGWEWLVPFRALAFEPDGGLEVTPLDGGPTRRAIARFAVREQYVPRSRLEEETSDPVAAARGRVERLVTLREGVDLVRSEGVVPLAATLLVYRSDERVRYDLDLLDLAVLRDPRAGRLPLARRVRRSSRLAFAIDSFIAKGELSPMNARALEVLTETHGLTPLELSQVLGGVREFATSALEALVARGLAALDRRTGTYRPRFDAFLPVPTGGRDEALPPLPNPQLRTSVMELLAAADARATCPLCGDALPAGWRSIVCARCQSEIGTAGGT